MQLYEYALSRGQCNEARSHRRYETNNSTLMGSQKFLSFVHESDSDYFEHGKDTLQRID